MALLTRNVIGSTKPSAPITSISTVKEFEIPVKFLEDKNRPKALVSWWFHCLREVKKSSKLPFGAQLRPAKQLVDTLGFEQAALLVRKAFGLGKWTPSLWWISRHTKDI